MSTTLDRLVADAAEAAAALTNEEFTEYLDRAERTPGWTDRLTRFLVDLREAGRALEDTT